MSDQVIMHQIFVQRLHESFIGSIFKVYTVIDAGIIDEPVNLSCLFQNCR